jgi:hypothetical protein
MYKQTKPFFEGAEATTVQRLSDSACIPFDPANTDYQAFLKYQAEGGKVYGADEEIPQGNTPTPADE